MIPEVRRMVSCDFLGSATRSCVAIATITSAGWLVGCTAPPTRYTANRSTTQVSPELAKSSYWYDQPAVVHVDYGNFDKLWSVAQRAVRDAGFRPDRIDPRDGVLTTEPLISKQAFEVWRSDVVKLSDLADSTLSTIRRTVRFQVSRLSDGSFQLVPKVLVERYSLVEHRVTSVTQYQEVFALTHEEAVHQQELQRNPLAPNPDGDVPPEYYYAIGRDHALERRLAEQIAARLGVRAEYGPPKPAVAPAVRPSGLLKQDATQPTTRGGSDGR